MMHSLLCQWVTEVCGGALSADFEHDKPQSILSINIHDDKDYEYDRIQYLFRGGSEKIMSSILWCISLERRSRLPRLMFSTLTLGGDCNVLNADSVDQSVTWKKHQDLAGVTGGRARLRFHLTNARLYSFRVADR